MLAIIAAMAVSIVMLWPAPTLANQKLQPGDVLEFSIASLPALRQKVTVNLDGDIELTLLPPIKAAGLALVDLKAKVKELMSARPLRQRTPDGRDGLVTVDPDEITLNIAEYRPIYITGDVTNPGERPFRPGMTARHAMALAGGLDALKSKVGNPFIEGLDLRAEYETVALEVGRQTALIARLDAEISGADAMAKTDMSAQPTPLTLGNAMLSREVGQFEARRRDFMKQRAFLEESIKQAEKYFDVLTAQLKNERLGSDLDASEFTRINELFAKGAVPITRVTETRRTMLLSSTRVLQTGAQVEQSQLQRQAFIRDLQSMDDKRQAELLALQQDAVIKLQALQSRLRVASLKLRYVTGLQADIAEAGRRKEIEMTVFRRDGVDGREQSVVVSNDTPLQPGDVLDVTLQVDDRTGALLR